MKHFLPKFVIFVLKFIMNWKRWEMREEFVGWELEGVQERKCSLHSIIGKSYLRRWRLSWHKHFFQQWRQTLVHLSLCSLFGAAEVTRGCSNSPESCSGASSFKQDQGIEVETMEVRRDFLNGFYCCATAIWEGNFYLSPLTIHHPEPAEWPHGLLLSRKAKHRGLYGYLLSWCVFSSLRKQIRWPVPENTLPKNLTAAGMCWHLTCPLFVSCAKYHFLGEDRTAQRRAINQNEMTLPKKSCL